MKRIKKLSLLILISLMGLVMACQAKEDLAQEPDLNRAPQVETDDLDRRIASMDLDEKIGQLMIVGFEEDQLSPALKDRIQDLSPGGLILFQRNIKESSQLVELLNSIKTYNKSLDKIPLFIATDEEGGQVSRLPKDLKKNPSAQEIGKLWDLNLVRSFANHSAKILANLGINMNNAPVLDVRYNPNNELTRTRTYGNNPEKVGQYGLINIEEYQGQDIIAVAKHFPGHGSTDVDSHVSLPIVSKDRETLLKEDLAPFKMAIDNGVDGIMVSHVLYRDIDSRPATLSKAIIQDLLIEELGYRNLIISDDMTMGAITNSYEPEKAAVEFLKAGGDLVLLCHGDSIGFEFRNELKSQIKKGNLSLEDIDKKLYKILKMKEKYRIQDQLLQVGSREDMNLQLENIMRDPNITREDQEILGR